MKIELKNVKINKSFSQETTCFMASVYINGNRAAYAQNDGRGGNTYYRAYDRFAGLVEDAEKYCLTLPDEHVDLGNGSKFVLSQSLETVIDNLLIEKELEKEKKEIDKLCLSNIVWGKPNGGTYKYMGFKGKPTIEHVKNVSNGQQSLDRLINRVKSQLVEGEVIFNKNI